MSKNKSEKKSKKQAKQNKGMFDEKGSYTGMQDNNMQPEQENCQK